MLLGAWSVTSMFIRCSAWFGSVGLGFRIPLVFICRSLSWTLKNWIQSLYEYFFAAPPHFRQTIKTGLKFLHRPPDAVERKHTNGVPISKLNEVQTRIKNTQIRNCIILPNVQAQRWTALAQSVLLGARSVTMQFIRCSALFGSVRLVLVPETFMRLCSLLLLKTVTDKFASPNSALTLRFCFGLRTQPRYSYANSEFE